MDYQGLQKILTYAYETVPYFNNAINRIGLDLEELSLPEDIEQLPIFEKTQIINLGWSNFISNQYLDDSHQLKHDDNLKIEHTSGTTHQSVQIPWKKDEYYASTVSHWRLRRSYYHITPNCRKCESVLEHGLNKPFLIDLVKNTMTINGAGLSYGRILYTLQNIQKFRPNWLYIQPSVLFLLVKVAKDNNISFPSSIRYIEYMGEPLLDYYRDGIESYIHAPTANMYGCTETNGIAMECPHGNLHIMADNVYVEVLDEKNHSVINQTGNICVTGLHNSIMPIVRYKLQDKGMISDRTCLCGKTGPVVSLAVGRLPQFLIFDEAKQPAAVYYPYQLLGLTKYQVGDLLFCLDMVDIDCYMVTFDRKAVRGKDREKIENIFRSVCQYFGINKIKFMFTYSKLNAKDKLCGILRTRV